LDGVSDGRPASKAGLKGGDVVIKLGDYSIKKVQDYMKALGNFKKGDTVNVEVIRDGKNLVLPVTF
jgi:S1-C subfamily serine protease